ncbi:MAG: gas vesicle protein GvpD P-loop domain-containing protein [Candidatus Jordarchaeaceae archaeon]
MLSVRKSVPDEILSLLEPGGYSLHIKGQAGTGKTSFALQVVRSLSSIGTVIYLSTRISPERVLIQFPWIKGFLEEYNILDAKRSYVSPDVPKSLLFEYTDQPEFIRSINERIQTAERHPVTVIIDSLDALKSNLELGEKDITLETILLEIGEKSATNMLFITETSEPCKLDYLVDGVVKLEKEIMDGKLIRKIYLEKIRGGEIERPYYLFTLKDSKFTTFIPRLFPRIKYVSMKDSQKPIRELIPTSIQELDRVFKGGLRKGTLNLLETTRGVGTEYFYFLFPILSSFIQKRFPVFMLPSQNATTKLTMNYLTSIMGVSKDENTMSQLGKFLFFFQFVETAEKTPWNQINVSREDITQFTETFKKMVTEKVEELGAETFLWFLGADTMERIYGEETFRRTIGNLVLETSARNGIILALAKYGIKSMDTLTHLASTHLVMDNRGTPIIYGEFPKTKTYAIVTETTKEGADRIELEGIE